MSGNDIRVFLTILIACAFFTNTYLTTNDASRFALTVAIVETRSFEVTEILPRVISDNWKVLDFAMIGDRVYSDKAPLGSFLAIPAYFAATRAGLPFPWIVYVTSLFTTGLITALTCVILLRIARLWQRGERLGITVALAYGLATMSLFYGTVLFSSAITAFCGIASFYLIEKSGLAPRKSFLIAFAAGLTASAAGASDYYAGITALFLTIYALATRKVSPLLFIFGAAVPLVLLLTYNQLAFGAPWPLSYRYARLFNDYHASGFYGITIPGIENLRRLGEVLFSRWGFFFPNIMIVAALLASRSFARAMKPQAILTVALAVAFLYLNSCESWLDAYSARFFMPVMPFLILPLLFMDTRSRLHRRAFFMLFGFAAAVSLIGNDRFLLERMDVYIPWAQNIVSQIMMSAGHRPGPVSLIPPFVLITIVWIVPPAKMTRSLPNQSIN